jgi:fluoride exporter
MVGAQYPHERSSLQTWASLLHNLRAAYSARMERVAVIGAFGALGAIARYAVQTAFISALGRPTVLGTFVVNISGALVLGLLIALTESRIAVSGTTRSALTVGFLGSYTTFSTLMLETVEQSQIGDTALAVFYLGASIALGLVVCYAGLQIGRALS